MYYYKQTMVAGKIYKYKKRSQKSMPFSRKQVQAVKRIATSTAEKKYKDMSQSAATTLTNAAPLDFNIQDDFVVSQGDTSSSRDGDQITLKDMKFLVQLYNSTAGGPTIHRLYVLQWLDDDEPTGITNIQAHDYFPRLDASGRKYRVLYDKLVNMRVNDADDNAYSLTRINLGKKIRGLKINYDSSGNIIKNNIKLYITTLRGTAVGHVVNGRMDFTDT